MDSLRAWGEPDAPLMLVLEAPTKDDVDSGGLLSGYPGKMISRLVQREHLQVITVFDHQLPKSLKGDTWATALASFRDAMVGHSAKVVVPMGSIALEACMGTSQRNILDWRGYVMDPATAALVKVRQMESGFLRKSSRKDGQGGWLYRKGDLFSKLVARELPSVLPAGVQHVIPTITPQTVQKSQLALLDVMAADLNRAGRLLHHGAGYPLSGDANAFTYGTTLDHPQLTPDVMAVDIENWSGSIEQIGFANQHCTVSVPWDENKPQAQALLSKCRTFIAHNAAFDYEHLTNAGADLSRAKLWCSMLASYMLQPDGKKSLNWNISLYMDARRHKHLSGAQPEVYNALDAHQTYSLAQALRHKLSDSGQRDFFERGMMPALPTLVRMGIRGVPVDEAHTDAWRTALALARAKVLNETTHRDLLRKPLLLARHLKIRSAAEEHLLALKRKGHPETELIDQVLKYREVTKNLNTYATARGPRVFPRYIPGARDTDEANKGIAYSGRPTASKPNIQNQPPEARRMFVPDTGKVLLSLDWSQIEPRITAALSHDDNLAADIEAGLYDAVAATLSCERSTAKTVVLLSAYLGSPRTLQTQLMLRGVDKSYAECRSLQDRMFARYDRWRVWRNDVINHATMNRALNNCFGKRAPFNRVHPAKAVNFHPQSTAACILWFCLPQVEAAIAPFDAQILATVHDEILMQCPPENLLATNEAAREVMEQEWHQVVQGFRVPTKSKTGANWRDMQEVDSPWRAYEM